MSNKRKEGVTTDMTDCIFCKIVNKDIPGQVVYESENVLVFKDIHPVAPVHLLVIPKTHIDNICDAKLLEGGLGVEIFQAIQAVAAGENLKTKGFRTVINCGPDAGEAVPHLHFHLLAGRSLDWPPG